LAFFDLSFLCDDRAFIVLIRFLIVNLTEKKIPLIDDTPAELKCTVCLLPMQYQKKINDVFLKLGALLNENSVL
jgi:hypothetical protein